MNPTLSKNQIPVIDARINANVPAIADTRADARITANVPAIADARITANVPAIADARITANVPAMITNGALQSFGDREIYEANTVYQATLFDIIVEGIIWQNYEADRGGKICIFVDPIINPPTSKRGSASTFTARDGPQTHITENSFCVTVKKNEYFKLTYDQNLVGPASMTYYFSGRPIT